MKIIKLNSIWLMFAVAILLGALFAYILAQSDKKVAENVDVKKGVEFSENIYKVTLNIIGTEDDKPEDYNKSLTLYVANKLGLFDSGATMVDSVLSNMNMHFKKANLPDKSMTMLNENGEIELYIDTSKTKKPEILVESDSYATIKLEKAEKKVEKFIADEKYCEENDDCSIRMNVCTEGSFNYYQKYLDVYGCEYPQGKLDEERQCVIQEEFSNPSCVNNRCESNARYTDECVPVPF